MSGDWTTYFFKKNHSCHTQSWGYLSLCLSLTLSFSYSLHPPIPCLSQQINHYSIFFFSSFGCNCIRLGSNALKRQLAYTFFIVFTQVPPHLLFFCIVRGCHQILVFYCKQSVMPDALIQSYSLSLRQIEVHFSSQGHFNSLLIDSSNL